MLSDGLTNGAMGTVTNIVIDQTTGHMNVILVTFDSEHVGQETRYTSIYNSRNQNAVPIHQTQATLPVHKKTSFQATRTQFPLTPCLGLSQYTNVKDSHFLKLS